jgi:PAS domain S-box-containing protein
MTTEKVLDPDEARPKRSFRDTALRFWSQFSTTEWCGLFTTIVSCIVLVGWIIRSRTLISVGFDLPAMAVSTAVAFLLSSAALWQLRTHEKGVVTGPAAQLLALAITGIGLYSLAIYAIDALHHTLPPPFEPIHHRPWLPFNRMSPNCAINFILFGIAVGLADVRRSGDRWPSQMLALIVMLDAALALVGHFHGALPLFGLTDYFGMAPHTALVFLVLSLGFLFARPDRGIMAIMLSDSIAGRAGRRILPVLIAVPVILEGISAATMRLSHTTSSILGYIFVAVGISVIAWLLWRNVTDLHAQVALAASYARKVADLEREKIEDALTVTEERLAFAVEGAGIGTWHWDLLTDQVVWSNTCKTLFGLPANTQAVPNIDQERVHPDDRERSKSAIALALKNKKAYEIEYRVLWPDDSVHWLLAKGRAYFDRTGQAIRFEGTVQNIDARKRAEQALQEAAEHERTLLKDVLASVTGGKLRLCDSPAEMPAPLPHTSRTLALTRTEGLSALRRCVNDMAVALGFPDDRCQGLMTAASEAGMNAVTHGGGFGTGLVSTNDKDLIQVRIEDSGTGIQMALLPRATLAIGWTSKKGLGHGLMMMLDLADRVWILTGPTGTTLVLEQERLEPLPAWL